MKFIIPKIVCNFNGYELVKFKLNNRKNFPLIYVKKPKKPIVAFKKFYGILIDDLFYRLSKEEQMSAVWHEIYHTKSSTGIKLFFWLPLKRIFNKEKRRYNVSQLEEFDADRYASIKTSSVSVLGLLNKLNSFEKQGLIKSNLKNHPSIRDRILNIKSLYNPSCHSNSSHRH